MAFLSTLTAPPQEGPPRNAYQSTAPRRHQRFDGIDEPK